MTDEEIEIIRSANERAERNRTEIKQDSKKLSMSDHLDLIQGSLRLCAVAALFCAEAETLAVFREWVKKMKIYPEQNWITTQVLAHASVVTMDHSKAGEQIRNLEGLVNAFAKELMKGGS